MANQKLKNENYALGHQDGEIDAIIAILARHPKGRAIEMLKAALDHFLDE